MSHNRSQVLFFVVCLAVMDSDLSDSRLIRRTVPPRDGRTLSLVWVVSLDTFRHRTETVEEFASLNANLETFKIIEILMNHFD